MAGNKPFHGCFQVFIKNSWGISIITAWMSIGNLPSLKIMHPTWAEILWHKVVKFYRCLYSWGANLPPPTIQTSATLQSFIFISFQQMTFNLGNFNFSQVDRIALTGHSQSWKNHGRPSIPTTLSLLAPMQGPQLGTYMYFVCSVTKMVPCWGVCSSQKELFPVLSVQGNVVVVWNNEFTFYWLPV